MSDPRSLTDIGLRAIGQMVADHALERLKGQTIKTEHEYELLHGTIKAAVCSVLSEEEAT